MSYVSDFIRHYWARVPVSLHLEEENGKKYIPVVRIYRTY
jgi:hypothetical protein